MVSLNAAIVPKQRNTAGINLTLMYL